MNKKLASIFWGIILIAGGFYTLARSMGYEASQDATVWAIIFGIISATALVLYLIDGVKQWGWLFPVGIFGGLACILAFAASGEDSPAMAAPLFIGIGLPFIVAFIVDRAHNWWALIPAGVMVFLVLVLLAVDNVAGEWIGAGFLFILAAAFFLVYLTRRALWALIVAYVLFVLGFMPLMALTPHPELSGIIVFFAIGLPFLAVYIKNPKHWWALFPAGFFLTIGVVTGIVLLPGIPSEEYDDRLANALVFFGVAVTFAVAWMRHQKRWAMGFTALAILLAVGSLTFGNWQYVWPLFIILMGAYLLFTALRSKAR